MKTKLTIGIPGVSTGVNSDISQGPEVDEIFAGVVSDSDSNSNILGYQLPSEDDKAIYKLTTQIESMYSVTMSDGSVMNSPVTFTSEEISYLYDYLNGKFYVNSGRKRAAELAYQKYQQLLQWYSELTSESYNNAYNSERSQVERMRDAGLNPDLLGVSGDSSSDVGAGLSPASVPETSSDFSQTFGVVANLINSATSLLSVVGEGVKLASAIRQINIGNVSSILNDVLPGAVNLLPESAFSDAGSFNSSLTSILRSSGMSRRQISRVRDTFKGLGIPLSSVRDFFSLSEESRSKRASLFKLNSNPLYDESLDMMSNLLVAEYNRSLYGALYDSALSQYNSTVLSSKDASLEGAASNSLNRQTLNDEELQVASNRLEILKYASIFPLVDSARENILSDDPYRQYVGICQLSSALHGNDSMWGSISSLFSTVGSDENSGLGRSLKTLVGTVSDSGDGLNNILVEIRKFMNGGYNDFLGQKFDEIKAFFSKVDSFIIGKTKSTWNELSDDWNRIKQEWKKPFNERDSSGNSIDTIIDFY